MVLQNKSDGCESRFIQEIVKVVEGNLNRAVLSVALHPVGIDSRIDNMALYGMGGIGKSTLVKTAYNLNFDKFDGNSFLANVNKTLERHNGLVILQNEIEKMLDHLRRIKSEGDLDSFKIDQIEKLEMDLRLLRTFVKFSHFLWPNSVVKITKKARRIVKMLCGDFVGIPNECKTKLDLKRLESQLLEVIDETEQINAEVTMMWSADVALKPHYMVDPSQHLSSQHSNPVSDGDEIVGFDIAIEKLVRHLTRGTSELDVIPTVGMEEQGKTTIARKV
ncbi:hypothetical protein BC332_14433 [Capsicum chinense]|nr:hypothetical protein BC332_14433 [Capsicum chinense]